MCFPNPNTVCPYKYKYRRLFFFPLGSIAAASKTSNRALISPQSICHPHTRWLTKNPPAPRLPSPSPRPPEAPRPREDATKTATAPPLPAAGIREAGPGRRDRTIALKPTAAAAGPPARTAAAAPVARSASRAGGTREGLVRNRSFLFRVSRRANHRSRRG